MNKIIVAICLILQSTTIFAKPIKIVTSTTPVAAIVSMILPQEAKIEAINISNGCPHHYQGKISDRQKLNNADYFIYINKKFDSFAVRMLNHFNGEIIQISDISTVNFASDYNDKNWHFWLNLDNVLTVQKHVAELLIKHHPHLEQEILEKQNLAKKKITSLQLSAKNVFNNLPTLLLTNDSLEHLFIKNNIKISYFKQQKLLSLKQYQDLQHILTDGTKYCIVTDSDQKRELYNQYKHPVIALNSENWSVSNDFVDYSYMYEKHYLEILKKLKGCNLN
ncbi:MAG: hypothetical protein DGJ47_000061 [Rickettsiaceae bacterium]